MYGTCLTFNASKNIRRFVIERLSFLIQKNFDGMKAIHSPKSSGRREKAATSSLVNLVECGVCKTTSVRLKNKQRNVNECFLCYSIKCKQKCVKCSSLSVSYARLVIMLHAIHINPMRHTLQWAPATSVVWTHVRRLTTVVLLWDFALWVFSITQRYNGLRWLWLILIAFPNLRSERACILKNTRCNNKIINK